MDLALMSHLISSDLKRDIYQIHCLTVSIYAAASICSSPLPPYFLLVFECVGIFLVQCGTNSHLYASKLQHFIACHTFLAAATFATITDA